MSILKRMSRFPKIACYLVGGNLFLILMLSITGVDDQNASFILALLVSFINMPGIWIVHSMGGSDELAGLYVASTIQWSLISAIAAGIFPGRVQPAIPSEGSNGTE